MIDFKRNNLDTAISPYLLAHQHNPIHWQEWSVDVVRYAQQNDKLIFISTGYLTCSWCSLMCQDAFQNLEIADYLNEHFVSIKVDREQRPDIDQYLLFYSIESQGNAGWPLNAFFTPSFKPFAACTFLPSKTGFNLPPFLDALHKVKNFYDEHHATIKDYSLPVIAAPDFPSINILPAMELTFDTVNGGFGSAPKLPPHSTLLFLLYFFEHTHHQTAFTILKKTLDSMAMRGLHDHLQGGFFKYCIDPAWHVPHLEKSLYDQALLLWIYSAAYKILKEPTYKLVAENIMHCLREEFAVGDLYYSSSAPTVSTEQEQPFLWHKNDITNILSASEFQEFMHVYEMPTTSEPFHLIKTRLQPLPSLEKKLLEARNKRVKWVRDKKILTSWNALAGIGFCMAYRCLDDKQALTTSQNIFQALLTINNVNNTIRHSSFDAQPQQETFLTDVTCLLLLSTYLYEDTHQHKDIMERLHHYMLTFKQQDVWYEGINTNFFNIPAQIMDQSLPSSISLASLATWRVASLLNQPYTPGTNYKEPLHVDFYNMTTLLSQEALVIETPNPLRWAHLPLRFIQRPEKNIRLCKGTACKDFATPDALINALSV